MNSGPSGRPAPGKNPAPSSRAYPFVESTAKGLFLRLKIIPRSPKNSVEGVLGDALKVKVTAPPVEGEANRGLISFLAGFLGVKKNALSIDSGEKSRIKRVRVDGMTRMELEELLGRKLSVGGLIPFAGRGV